MKIAVYTITKNESKFIERWAKSAEGADYKLIVDTGSTDDTLEVAKKVGCNVASITISPWRFDDARNAALALIPHDIDMCVSLDADEMLMPGWREHLESLPENVTRPRYKYVWSWNPDGSEGITFYRDHIHKRHGYRWKHPVHEIVIPVGEEVQAYCGLEVHHHPDNTKSRGQYLPLLELAIKENPDDDRNQFYLGREYIFYNQPENAIPHLMKHLELSTWAAERAASMRYLGKATGRREHWILRACAESPERREPWVDLAQLYYETNNWPGCFSAAWRALSITEKPLEYLCEPDAWGQLPHDLAGIASWNLGMKKQAIYHTVNALSLASWDGRIRKNAEMMYKDIRTTDVGVVIPCKSNIDGLLAIISQLKNEKSVKKICVVADGEEALDNIYAALPQEFDEMMIIISVSKGIGIHRMWNDGASALAPYGAMHILYANDDITIDEGAVDSMAGLLDFHENIGVICPNYDGRTVIGSSVEVTIACPGRYDGTDGLAGFCFLLRSDVANEWQFDERMKWYYGDNDIVNWVRLLGKVAAISGISTMQTNPSWTKRNDPPADFDKITERDRKIFEEKWNTDGTLR